MNNELAKRTNKVIEDLQQENTQLKMQIDELIKWLEDEIKSSGERKEEWVLEKQNHKENEEYKNACHQNIMIHLNHISAFEEVLSKLKEVKKDEQKDI